MGDGPRQDINIRAASWMTPREFDARLKAAAVGAEITYAWGGHFLPAGCAVAPRVRMLDDAGKVMAFQARCPDRTIRWVARKLDPRSAPGGRRAPHDRRDEAALMALIAATAKSGQRLPGICQIAGRCGIRQVDVLPTLTRLVEAGQIELAMHGAGTNIWRVATVCATGAQTLAPALGSRGRPAVRARDRKS